MKLQIFQVDAFTNQLFKGNPAAVCPLTEWLSDETMQAIAAENNLAETAFYIPSGDGFHLRWFTPTVEVDLCGHATLASAHVLWHHAGYDKDAIQFQSRSGELVVTRQDQWLTLDFPADKIALIDCPEAISTALGIIPLEVWKGKTDYLVVLENQQQVAALTPDFRLLASLSEVRGTIVTAPGEQEDFVSRCFFPQSGIDEDPVTGSAHTTMILYWSQKLGKQQLTARQISKRSGFLQCVHAQERVEISGQAVTYLTGEIEV